MLAFARRRRVEDSGRRRARERRCGASSSAEKHTTLPNRALLAITQRTAHVSSNETQRGSYGSVTQTSLQPFTAAPGARAPSQIAGRSRRHPSFGCECDEPHDASPSQSDEQQQLAAVRRRRRRGGTANGALRGRPAAHAGRRPRSTATAPARLPARAHRRAPARLDSHGRQGRAGSSGL